MGVNIWGDVEEMPLCWRDYICIWLLGFLIVIVGYPTLEGREDQL